VWKCCGITWNDDNDDADKDDDDDDDVTCSPNLHEPQMGW